MDQSLVQGDWRYVGQGDKDCGHFLLHSKPSSFIHSFVSSVVQSFVRSLVCPETRAVGSSCFGLIWRNLLG